MKAPEPNASAVTPPDDDYVIGIHTAWDAVAASEWDGLLARQRTPTPFMRHGYLSALDASGSAAPATGWQAVIFTLRQRPTGTGPDGDLLAAAVLYLKNHSYGEYVFDWAWADAYQRHGLDYYPKAVLAVPFTPVPGSRLLAIDDPLRRRLLQAMLGWTRQARLSSLHLLFGDADDQAAAAALGLLQRDGVQFHWHNAQPSAYQNFEQFLGALNHDKRKKIRQERRKVAQAGVTFRERRGAAIQDDDWNFFYRCYQQTYLEHGNAPYLTRDFFAQLAQVDGQDWLMFIAERAGQPIGCSLLALQTLPGGQPSVVYGRYWGALETISCLHFEACYYQPIDWCIRHGVQRFEGGAQGEHKMARALMPAATASAHWLAQPAFASAVESFLERERTGVGQYLDELQERTPFHR